MVKLSAAFSLKLFPKQHSPSRNHLNNLYDPNFKGDNREICDS